MTKCYPPDDLYPTATVKVDPLDRLMVIQIDASKCSRVSRYEARETGDRLSEVIAMQTRRFLLDALDNNK